MVSLQHRARVRVDANGVNARARAAIIKTVEMVFGEEAGNSVWHVSIATVSSAAMRRLYKRYCGKDKVTDVLSFAYGEAPQGEGKQGEIVLCVPEARKRSRADKTSFRRAFAWLIVHGCLHILGYDHSSAAQARAMKVREEYYLGKRIMFPDTV